MNDFEHGSCFAISKSDVSQWRGGGGGGGREEGRVEGGGGEGRRKERGRVRSHQTGVCGTQELH